LLAPLLLLLHALRILLSCCLNLIFYSLKLQRQFRKCTPTIYLRWCTNCTHGILRYVSWRWYWSRVLFGSQFTCRNVHEMTVCFLAGWYSRGVLG
jgi:hypothetical protein